MLTILDKYILKKYLSTFGFVILIFSLISLVIDFSEKVEDFIDKKPSTYEIVVHYFLNFIPHINAMLFPLYALISVIFFTSRMASNSEIISILGAGVRFERILKPYLIGAVIIGGTLLISNHFILPVCNQIRLKFERTYVWANISDKSKTENIHMFLDKDTKIFVKFYRKQDTTARDFRMEHFKKGELSSVLQATEMSWQFNIQKWRLRNYKIHTFDGLKESIVIGGNEVLDTAINLRHNDFIRFLNQKETLTSDKLLSFINREASRGVGNLKEFEIELYRRTADPFTIIILTIIGVVMAARKVRGGMGLHLAMGIGIGALFIFLSKVSATFSTNDNLPAILGVWIPNIIFSIVAYFLLKNAQK